MDLHGACYHSTSDVSGAVSAPPFLPFVVPSTNWLFAGGFDGFDGTNPSQYLCHCTLYVAGTWFDAHSGSE